MGTLINIFPFQTMIIIFKLFLDMLSLNQLLILYFAAFKLIIISDQ